jgi:hypothetical protein
VIFDELRTHSDRGDLVAATHGAADQPSWKEADRALRRIAARRAGLDAEEARWLLVARDAEVHRRFGFASFAEYVERVLGYGPRTLTDRLRVAEALQRLPMTADALAAGRLSYSAVRELTRVATAATEEAWLDAARGRTAREVEAQVAGHRAGDLPGDPPDPELRTFALRFELSPEILALFRDARRHVVDEAGGPLSDEEVLAAMCRATLCHGPETPQRSRPAYQVSITVCEGCRRGWQDGAGQPIEIGPAVVEQARCDALEAGRVDGDMPTRTTPTIPTKIRNLVMRRDHHRCMVPGCRASRHLEVHHLRARAEGGTNEPSNLAVLCDGHHRALHRGRLVITGKPGALGFAHADGRPWGTPPRDGSSSTAEEVRAALRRLGFSNREASDAVTAAEAHVGNDDSMETWLRAALRATRSPAAQVHGSDDPSKTVVVRTGVREREERGRGREVIDD